MAEGGSDGSLRFDTKIDTSDFDVSISTLEKALDRFSEVVDKLSEHIAQGFTNAGSAASGAAANVDSVGTAAEKTGRSINEAFNNSTQISSLENQIAQTEEKIRLLKAELDRMGDAKVPTEEYSTLSKLVERTQLKLDALLERQQKLDDQGVKHNSTRWKNLQYDINETSKRLKIYKEELQDTVDRDRAFTSGQDGAAYEKKSNALEILNNRLYVQKQRLMELVGKEREAATESSKLRKIAESAEVGNKKIAELNSRLSELKERQKELQSAGLGYGYQEYDSNAREIADITARLNEYKHALSSAGGQFTKPPGLIENAFSKASDAVWNFGKSLGNGLAGKAKQAVKNLRGVGKTSNSVSKSILKLSNMFKLMLIRMAMRAAIQGVREGMQNLVQYSDSANRSVSDLMSGMTYLKNSFAAAFAPILSYVAPALNTLISLLGTAIGYVNQFFSALGGSSTFIRAKKVNEDYAKSLKETGKAAKQAGKDAKKALAPFDELTVLQEQAASGSSSGVDPKDMFETVAVSDSFSGFAEQIRQAFEAGDWRGLGALIGRKFNETVSKIGWAGIGRKMGYSINGAIQTAYYTLSEADFKNLGIHIAELLNSTLSEMDFSFIGRLLVRGFTAGIDFLIGLLGGLDWRLVGKRVGDLLRGALDEGREWITDIDWSQMGEDLYTNLKEFLTGMDFDALAESFFGALGAAFGGLAEFLGGLIGAGVEDSKEYFQKKVEECGGNVVAGIFKGIGDAISGMGSIGEWIYDHITKPFIDGFCEAFGIQRDDSVVMDELGRSLMRGLYSGIDFVIPDVIEQFFRLKDDIEKALSQINEYMNGDFLEGWKKGWDLVKESFKDRFNGIIGLLESALNFIVDGINKLSFDVPEWVPEAGGSKFGFDIQPFHLPRLASGTVVPPRAGEFAAILGDNNREAEVVSPISAMKQAFKEAVAEMGEVGGGDITLTVNLDGQVVYEDVVKRNRAMRRRTGKNLLLV